VLLDKHCLVVSSIALVPFLSRIIQKADDRGQKTEDRKQRTEDRRQRTESGRQRTDDRGQKTEDRKQKTDDGGQNSEVGSRTRRRPKRKGLCRGTDAASGP
jgi:hypothetical protein